MNYYLVGKRLGSVQFRSKRRDDPSGAIGLHSTESIADVVAPDDGAERVAQFIKDRTTPGSYHTMVDADGPLPLVPYWFEAFHDGTGGNRWSLSISFAMQAHQWPTLPGWWIEQALSHAADEASRMSDWIFEQRGFRVPARRITASQYRSGEAGFISHGEIDPGRRSDPGLAFPWGRFFELYEEAEKAKTQLFLPLPEVGTEIQENKAVVLAQAIVEVDAIFEATGHSYTESDRAFWHRRMADIVYGGRREASRGHESAEEAVKTQLVWVFKQVTK